MRPIVEAVGLDRCFLHRTIGILQLRIFDFLSFFAYSFSFGWASLLDGLVLHWGGRGNVMNPIDTVLAIPNDVKAQLQETLDDLVKGIRRPDEMRAACQRMDRMREENRKLFGEQNIAVDLICDSRDHS
jgi:hypothetical protein